MKCPYEEDFECNWPTIIGDIECGSCSHFTGVVLKSKKDMDWLDKLITKFEKWWKGQK